MARFRNIRMEASCPSRMFRARWFNRKDTDEGRQFKISKIIGPGLTINDSMMRLFINSEEQPRLVPRKRGRINVRSTNLTNYPEYLFFLILDLPWLQLIVFTFGLGMLFFIVFGSIFWTIGGGFSWHRIEEELSYTSCIFFTLQTFDNIGYGLLSPNTSSGDVVASFTALLSNFVKIFFGGIFLLKLTNPKKLKYTNKFSKVAVWNKNTTSFNDTNYHPGVERLSFRVCRVFTGSTLCSSSFQLVYFKTFTDVDGYECFEFQELDFEINKQMDRNRDISFSLPLLGLPWTVVHPIDKNSPLYGLSLCDIEKEHGEVIGILEGSDEICADYYQARWSYKACDIIENQEFLPCVRRDDLGFISVDFSRLSQTRRIDTSDNALKKSSPLKKIAKLMKKSLKRTRKSFMKLSGTFKSKNGRRYSLPKISRGPERLLSTPLPRKSFSSGNMRSSFIDPVLRDMMKEIPCNVSLTESDKIAMQSPKLCTLPSTNTTIEVLPANELPDDVRSRTESIKEVEPSSFTGLRRRHSLNKISGSPRKFSPRWSPSNRINPVSESPID